MKKFLAESIDRVLLRLVSEVLSQYPVEEVQAAVNYLVSDSKWLAMHRLLTSPESKTIEALTSSWGRYEFDTSKYLRLDD